MKSLKPLIKTIDMLYKSLILLALVSSNFIPVSGQAIHYDYDDSGNRIKKYINLNKGNSSEKDTLKKTVEEDKKELEEFGEKLGEFSIKIYPNPTEGQLYVEINGLAFDETVDYQLFSQTGLILEMKKKIGCPITIDLDSYPGGLYILRLMIKDKISQWKILKE